MSLYHRIFFPEKNFQNLADINKLIPYMFLNKIVKEIKPNSVPILPVCQTPLNENESFISVIPTAINSVQSVKTSNNIFCPKKQDSLFWCIYIALYGYGKYNEIGHRYGNIEIEEKQKMMEMMRKNPCKIKDYPKRITKAAFQEIMSDFMTNKKMTMSMLAAIAVYHDKRFWIVTKDNMGKSQYYLDIFGSGIEKDNPVIIYKNNRNEYSIDFDVENSKIKNIENTLFCYENYDMPLKAISNYKIGELKIIAEKLNINLDSSITKKAEIYDSIISKCFTV